MAQTNDYEYRGLIAASWDLLRGDTATWPDRPFYRDAILHSGQPALDVGCGTGRLLLDYLATGIAIDGVDNSPEMLALCRDKARHRGLTPQLYEQPMERLALPRSYRTIIVPSSSFQLVTDPALATQALARFFAHLQPGGTLVMPFMLLWTGSATSGRIVGEWERVGEAIRPADGALVRRWSRATYEVDAQLEHTEDRYEIVREGVVVATEHHARSPATRWYTQAQARTLYETAGFTRIRLVHEFTAEPARPDDRIFCVVRHAALAARALVQTCGRKPRSGVPIRPPHERSGPAAVRTQSPDARIPRLGQGAGRRVRSAPPQPRRDERRARA